jgi:hypothetical protein
MTFGRYLYFPLVRAIFFYSYFHDKRTIWLHFDNILQRGEKYLKIKSNIIFVVNTKKWKKGKLLPKIKRSSEERHTQTPRKLIWYISMITDVFLNQKRVNVSEHTVNGVTREFWKVPSGGVARQEGEREGGKIKWVWYQGYV